MDKKMKSYVVSVSVGSGCYRHIRISGDATLEALSEAILDAFEFLNDHAHAFFMDNRAWSDADSYWAEYADEDDKERHSCDVTLQKLGLDTGQRFLYLFDFGDEWRFSCRILSVLDEPTDEPVILQAKGMPPRQYSDSFDEADHDEDMPE